MIETSIQSPRPVEHGGEGRDGRRLAREAEVEARRHRDRLAVGLTGAVHLVAHPVEHDLRRREVAVGAGLAEVGDRGEHDARVRRAEIVVGEAEPLERARPQRLDDGVGSRGELEHPIAFVPQVERDPALADVQVEEAERLAARIEWCTPPERVAAGRLDLDHVGAARREQLRAVRPGDMGCQVEDPQALERACGSSALMHQPRGKRTRTGPFAIVWPVWVFISTSTVATWPGIRRVIRDVGDGPVEVGDVAGQRRRAVWIIRLCTIVRPLARPVGEVVEHPRAHRRAVAVAARHADQLRVLLLHVAARRAVVEPVAEGRVDLRPLEVARHLGQPAGLVERRRRRRRARNAPQALIRNARHSVAEALDRVRPDRPASGASRPPTTMLRRSCPIVEEGPVVLELLALDRSSSSSVQSGSGSFAAKTRRAGAPPRRR